MKLLGVSWSCPPPPFELIERALRPEASPVVDARNDAMLCRLSENQLTLKRTSVGVGISESFGRYSGEHTRALCRRRWERSSSEAGDSAQLGSWETCMKTWVWSPAPLKSGVVHTCKTSTWDSEVGRTKVQGHPRLFTGFDTSLSYMILNNNKVPEVLFDLTDTHPHQASVSLYIKQDNETIKKPNSLLGR